MMVSIEQHVDWICDCLDWLDASDHQTIEAEREAQEAWVCTCRKWLRARFSLRVVHGT